MDANGFTIQHKKDGAVYTYHGNLRECMNKARKELDKKQNSNEELFLLWQYQRAEKAYKRYSQRVEDLKGFINAAKQQLQKIEEEKEAAGYEKNYSDRSV